MPDVRTRIPPWTARAKELHARGLSRCAIGRILKVPPSTAYYWIRDEAFREMKRQKNRETAARKSHAAKSGTSDPIISGCPDGEGATGNIAGGDMQGSAMHGASNAPCVSELWMALSS